jgi:hypothetical protein
MVQPSGVANRQLRATGGFELPQIQIPNTTRLILFGGAGLIFIVIVILGLGRFAGESLPVTIPNAIWLGPQYTYEQPNDAQVSNLVVRLREHSIGTVYAWVSLLQSTNTWSDTARLDRLRAFVDQLKRLYPEVRIYGWLSVDAQSTTDSPRLADQELQRIVADFSRRMTAEFGFDGVMLNVVPVANNDSNYLNLLRGVRSSIGEDSSLAVAVPPDWSPTEVGIPRAPDIEPGTVWEQNYKQRVALISDHIVVAAYNTGFTDSVDYARWMAYQVETYAAALAELQSTTELIIGVPAYSAAPLHDPLVENVESAVTGIQAGMQAAGEAAERITGIALYAEWEATESDWSQFRAMWLP